MIIDDPKLGKYCDEPNGLLCRCHNPHKSGGCVKHKTEFTLDGVCYECEKENETI